MPKKFLGQHFLSDPRILARIAASLPAAPGEPVLEIGPGRGALTAKLVERGFRVTAIERDRDLMPHLVERFPTVRFLEADALSVEWATAVAVEPGEPWFLIGNIPYRITSPLIEKALTDPRPRAIVFLVQKEVANRLTAEPGTAEYGALTVGVGSAAMVERLFPVAAGAFRPPPKVASVVIRITPRDGAVPADLRIGFRRLVVGLFGGRRKQLVRALRTVLDLGPEEALAVVRSAGLDPTQRPETLTGSEFERLFRVVVDGGRGERLTL